MKNEIIASNGYIGIIEIIYGINDYVKHTNGKKASILRYNSKGEAYFISYGRRYYMNEFVRV